MDQHGKIIKLNEGTRLKIQDKGGVEELLDDGIIFS